MKLPVTLISTALLAAAPAALRPAQAASAFNRSPEVAQGRTLSLPGIQDAAFGNPEVSAEGRLTRVSFALAPGVGYRLIPTFGGLRLDISGARVLPSVARDLAANLDEYRAGGGQVTLYTPFPLSLQDGWRAYENGSGARRRLVIELGPGVSGGGADRSLSGETLTGVPLPPEAQATLVPPSGSEDAGTAASGLPPGDHSDIVVRPPAPAPALGDLSRPSDLRGQVPGRLSPGAVVGVPRVGKTPGMTRLVLDLPPGVSYQMVPTALGLRVELRGLSVAPGAATNAQNTSAEVRSWRYEEVPGGVNFTVLTGAPTTSRSGWRALLLPPTPSNGNLARLAIDIAPALANLTPMTSANRVAQVPPVPATRGTAILALSAAYVRPRVVIDPGHGGRDPGAVGAVVEKEVNLKVARRVRDLLQAAGVDAELTREGDTALHPDKSTDLELRAQRGVPGTELFVSIHVNATEGRSLLLGYGVETWWNQNHGLSYALATTLQRELVQSTGAFDRGVKGYRSLSVLRNSRIPAALVEIGFTSHPVDGQNLQNANYLERVAYGIASGIAQALLSGVSASGPQPGQAASAP